MKKSHNGSTCKKCIWGKIHFALFVIKIDYFFSYLDIELHINNDVGISMLDISCCIHVHHITPHDYWLNVDFCTLNFKFCVFFTTFFLRTRNPCPRRASWAHRPRTSAWVVAKGARPPKKFLLIFWEFLSEKMHHYAEKTANTWAWVMALFH